MSVATAPGNSRANGLSAAGLRRLFRDRPTIPLLVLLAALVLVYALVRPGTVNAGSRTSWRNACRMRYRNM